MGQTASKTHGPLTLGHSAVKREEAPDDTPACDLVLLHPHLYALTDKPLPSPRPHSSSSSSSSSAVTTLGRVDSGYGGDPSKDYHYYYYHHHHRHNNASIAQELAYIDNTYYQSEAAALSAAVPSTVTTITTGMLIPAPEPGQLTVARLTLADAARVSADKSMQEIILSGQRLVSLTSNIGLLSMLRRLDLSHNQLERLPDVIGDLTNLEYLSLADNAFSTLPDALSRLTSLSELDVSHNTITDLAPVCHPHNSDTNLHILRAAHNELLSLTVDIVHLKQLATLDVSDNPLRVLPAELAQLPYLRRLIVDHCPLVTRIEQSTRHSPPSLLETCGRLLLRDRNADNRIRRLPHHLAAFIASAKPCTACHAPYIETHIKRGRWLEKPDIIVPLEYRLCSPHWNDEDDRLLFMFSQSDTLHIDDISARDLVRQPSTRNPMETAPANNNTSSPIANPPPQFHELSADDASSNISASHNTPSKLARWFIPQQQRLKNKRVNNNRGKSSLQLSRK
ncbi:hypothetical protein BCR43DRAFT_487740 [Syncephalastrum racemosum]|uniref:Uncharacterized protein n=1 Tax=Syncephalastrum racemosum TaxID=13706 RepID=A0A1X2HHK2_SYNRA|nr:hypothetical protein BCR43DRAFT_487740 [Syncephalastrum racemosum]